MDNQKFHIILDSLLERTQKEELNWKTTANSSKYLLALNDSSITIDSYESFDGIKITFSFRNEKGEAVESMEVLESEDEIFKHSSKLYDLARRKALKSDETIDRIIKQLKPDSITA